MFLQENKINNFIILSYLILFLFLFLNNQLVINTALLNKLANLKTHLISVNLEEDLNKTYEEQYQALLKNGDLDPDKFMDEIQR